MLKLGIIGTGWISAQFVDAAHQTNRYEVSAIYSRHEETAADFAQQIKAQATLYTDLDAFFAADFDVVYIASPNSLHAQQAVMALAAGKSAIVEKPLITHPQQLDALRDVLASHPDLFLFEAARHLYEENFAVIDEFVQQHPISGATLSYKKYSSKYDAYIDGKTPNVFSPQFAGGALMDLGVYLVYAAVKWFGMPDTANYRAHLLDSGVDGDGVMQLQYPHFAVNLITGKTSNSYLASEMYTDKDTLVFDPVGDLKSVTLVSGDSEQNLSRPVLPNPMVAEAEAFGQAIENHDRDFFTKQFALAQQVHTVMGTLRQSAGIVFAGDPE